MGVGARGIGQLKAAQLKQLAQTSVASPELAQQVSFEMRPLIAQHDLLDQQTPVRTRESPRSSTARTNWTMAKTGNAYLRAAAYRMAVVGVQHNPIIVPTTLANVPPASQR